MDKGIGGMRISFQINVSSLVQEHDSILEHLCSYANNESYHLALFHWHLMGAQIFRIISFPEDAVIAIKK